MPTADKGLAKLMQMLNKASLVPILTISFETEIIKSLSHRLEPVNIW